MAYHMTFWDCYATTWQIHVQWDERLFEGEHHQLILREWKDIPSD